MQNLQELIFGLLNDDTKTLVFTSEIVARSWLRKYTIKSGRKTVFLERAISWDKFKTSFINSGSLRQITSVERQIFANQFLRENFDKLTFFSSKYRESIAPFASAVAGYLPFFAYADEKSSDALHDINLIVSAYKKYLCDCGLFEYNFLPKDYGKINKDFVLIFPETFNDPIVDEISDRCTVFSTKSIDKKNGKIIAYKNSLTEIRSTLRDIAQRLDAGEDPNEISITCASLDTYRPYLESEAKKLDIEICFTSSIPITSSPQGRFFEAIHNVADKNYSFASMKAFMLDPGLPFRDVNANRNLLQDAIRLRLKNSPKEEWIRRLQGSSSFDYFVRLSGAVEGFLDSLNVDDFVSEFFVAESFFFTQNGVFEKCKSLLKQTCDYNLFLLILKDETYVDSARNGIRVYSYPVSAAISSDVQYIIGLDDRNTAISFDKYPYLPMYKKDLAELESTVKTDDVLSVFTNMNFNGTVLLSGTKNGFEGTRLLPISLTEIKEPSGQNNVYENERQLWLRLSDKHRFSKAQKESFEAAKKGVLDYESKYRIPGSDQLQNVDVTASAFKDFCKCPFKGFVSIYLHPKQLDLEPDYLDPRVVGEILHHSIQRALSEVKTLSNLSEEIIVRYLKSEIDCAVKKNRLGPKVYQDYLLNKYSKSLPGIASTVPGTALEDATLVGNEINPEKLHFIEGLTGVRLKGRIDTVLQNYEGYIVIDYKTTNNAKDAGTDLSDSNPQLQLYAQLLKDNYENANVVAGAYYTIADQTMRFVWPVTTKTASVSEQDADFDFVKKEESFRNAVLASDFPTDVDEDNCKKCLYSGICRGGFAAR